MDVLANTEQFHHEEKGGEDKGGEVLITEWRQKNTHLNIHVDDIVSYTLDIPRILEPFFHTLPFSATLTLESHIISVHDEAAEKSSE